MQEDTKEQEALKNFKKFFMVDMKIKQRILALAPDELDNCNEESRIEYADKLYKELKDLEIEFIEMAKKFGDEPEVIETIKEYFNKSKQAFLISKYNSVVINLLYQNIFSGMDEELIENVKKEFFGYGLNDGKLERCIKGAGSINELLHVFHSYLTNNNTMMEQLPVIATKQNAIEEPITLYGEETEISRELFEEFPLELDCDKTDIVSMKDKILMMIRGRGHALTIDIDVANKDAILVKYFVPKLCNRDMIEALPGINTNGISENGATGMFQTSKEEKMDVLFDFIKKVPTDFDSPQFQQYILEQQQPTIEDNEKVEEDNTQIYQIEEPQSKPSNLLEKIKKGISNLKRKVYGLFNKKDTLMLNAPGEERKIASSVEERIKFQEELSKGIGETPRADASKINEGQRTTQVTRDEE